MRLRNRVLLSACCTAAIVLPQRGHASLMVGGFTVIDTFHFVDARQPNDAGIHIGTRDSLGLNVTPVGTQPVTPQGGTTVQASQGGVNFVVPYLYSPVYPDQFFASVGGALQTGAWTLSLSNPSSTAARLRQFKPRRCERRPRRHSSSRSLL